MPPSPINLNLIDGKQFSNKNKEISKLFQTLENVFILKDSIRNLVESLKIQFYSKGRLNNNQYNALSNIVKYERIYASKEKSKILVKSPQSPQPILVKPPPPPLKPLKPSKPSVMYKSDLQLGKTYKDQFSKKKVLAVGKFEVFYRWTNNSNDTGEGSMPIQQFLETCKLL